MQTAAKLRIPNYRLLLKMREPIYKWEVADIQDTDSLILITSWGLFEYREDAERFLKAKIEGVS